MVRNSPNPFVRDMPKYLRISKMSVYGYPAQAFSQKWQFFFKNAVIQTKIAVTSKTMQLHIFRGL